MYLVRGRQKQELEDVEKAIGLAKNNVEAYVLKGLILLGKGDYQGGKEVFAEAERMNPGNCILDNLVAEAVNKIDPSCFCLADSGTTLGSFSRRLQSDLPLPDAEGLPEEIARRVTEFNHLYRELSKSVGGVTTKVPKELSFMNMSEQLEPLEMEASGASSNSVIAKLDDEVFTAQSQPEVVSTPAPPTENDHVGQSSVSNPETQEIAILIID